MPLTVAVNQSCCNTKIPGSDRLKSKEDKVDEKEEEGKGMETMFP